MSGAQGCWRKKTEHGSHRFDCSSRNRGGRFAHLRADAGQCCRACAEPSGTGSAERSQCQSIAVRAEPEKHCSVSCHRHAGNGRTCRSYFDSRPRASRAMDRAVPSADSGASCSNTGLSIPASTGGASSTKFRSCEGRTSQRRDGEGSGPILTRTRLNGLPADLQQRLQRVPAILQSIPEQPSERIQPPLRALRRRPNGSNEPRSTRPAEREHRSEYQSDNWRAARARYSERGGSYG